jgi:hypothetical protein
MKGDGNGRFSKCGGTPRGSPSCLEKGGLMSCKEKIKPRALFVTMHGVFVGAYNLR